MAAIQRCGSEVGKDSWKMFRGKHGSIFVPGLPWKCRSGRRYYASTRAQVAFAESHKGWQHRGRRLLGDKESFVSSEQATNWTAADGVVGILPTANSFERTKNAKENEEEEEEEEEEEQIRSWSEKSKKNNKQRRRRLLEDTKFEAMRAKMEALHNQLVESNEKLRTETGALHTDLHHDPAVSSATAAAFSSAAKAKTKALTPEAVAAAAHKDVSSSKKT